MTFVVYFIIRSSLFHHFILCCFSPPFPTFLPFLFFYHFLPPPLCSSPSSSLPFRHLLLSGFIRTCRNCVRSAVPSLASSGDGGQTESLMSPVKQPPHRSPSDTEALVTSAPSGTVQGPVIYAQLDHSGKAGDQINKSETVVYADIRKNC